jgi:hypothetical protein
MVKGSTVSIDNTNDLEVFVCSHLQTSPLPILNKMLRVLEQAMGHGFRSIST